VSLVTALLAAACTSDGAGAGSGQRAEDAVITFDVRGGDSFAWTKEVSGRSDCGDVTLEVNGEPVDVNVTMEGATFRSRVSLVPGSNDVVARCASRDETSAPLRYNVRLKPRPTARIGVKVDGDIVTLDGRRSGATQPHGLEVTSYRWSRDPLHPARLETAAGKRFTTASGPKLRLRAPARDGEYYVALEVSDAEGHSDRSITYFVVEDGRARRAHLMREHPSWIERAVIYAPIPVLWGNGGPKAVERRLGYLKDLGVDALWLWPPATLRATGEEYAITDYFDLDPSWGPKRAFKRMVDEAHRLGMHVLLDFVPNHMSNQSPYFKDAEKHREGSNYWSFFDRKANGEHTFYFDWDYLPNLNYDNPEVRNMIMEASVYWVRDLGLDGFRVDVAWGVKRRRPGFWKQWRRELKRVKPDLLLLAEASAVDPYYFSNGFDVAYDWTNQPGQWAWTSAFDFPEETGALLAPAITNGNRGFSPDANVMHFLNNNDTGIRFVDQYGPELTRVAATLQFTLPGTPEMFAGDEIGASYEPYSNLTPISWNDRHGLRPFYKRLIGLQDEFAALNSNQLELLSVDTNAALAYVRPAVGGSGPVVVLLNFGSKSRVEISGEPLAAALSATGGAMRDLLTDKTVTLAQDGGSVTVPLDAQSALVLVPDNT
jgi:cyclomaltodextrinase